MMFFIVLLLCISVAHRIMSAQNLPLNHFQPILLFRMTKIDLAKSAVPMFWCPNSTKTVTGQLWPYCQVRYVVSFDSGICILNIKWGICLEVFPWGSEDRSVGAVILSVILPFLLISSWWLVRRSRCVGNCWSHHGQIDCWWSHLMTIKISLSSSLCDNS